MIQEKSPLVENMTTNFHLADQASKVVGIPGARLSTGEPAAFLGPEGEAERGARMLTLAEALELAVRASRRYENAKETLYLAGLSLTLARHQFTPLFSSPNSIRYSGSQLTDEVVEQSRVGGGATWLMRNIGRLTTAFTADAVRFVSGDNSVVFSSSLGATFTRPLLRNAGFKSEMEALTQSERSMVYAVRDFVQFRKNFSVEVASAYYDVLRQRDAARNGYVRLQSSRKNAERGRELAREGRLKQSDLGRYEQDELTAELGWIGAIRSYKQQLDNFKILLGVTVDSNFVLDESELTALKILDPAIAVDEAVDIALKTRLDYMNARDQLADAARQVDLAADRLKPTIDFSAGATITSDPSKQKHFSLPDASQYSWNAGLDIDPGLDRKSERNFYRAALISRNRAARDVELQEDEIRLGVRDSWRTLDEAKRNFEISEIAVKLAERRVEEQDLLAELGRLSAQDQVDAQNDLVDSRNRRTQAIVAHTIARVQFWNRLGILYIKDNGQWEETQDATTQ